jgi:branched-subunit amino acid transport protein
VNIWLVMLAGGVLTYLTRLSLIALLGRVKIPHWLVRALRFVPPAVLSAIIFPELFMRQENLAITLDNTRMWAGLIAIFVAIWRRNTLLTISVGMAALLFLQWLDLRGQ